MYSTGFRNKATVELNDIKKVFDDFDISFFLISGAMLGAVREGDFIDHDWDIDLGSLDYPSEKTQLGIVGRLTKLGFDFQVDMSKKSGRMRFKRITTTDIHFFEVTDKQAVCKANEKPLLTFPKRFLKLDEAKLRKKTYKILDKGYLKWMYNDWETPMKDNYFNEGYDYVQKI